MSEAPRLPLRLPPVARPVGRGLERSAVWILGGTVVLLGAALWILFALRLDETVRAAGFVEPELIWRVHSPTGGVLESLPVRAGARVEPGDRLGRLATVSLDNELAELRLAAKHQVLHSGATRGEREALARRIRSVETELARRFLVAPAAGVVLTEELDRRIGGAVAPGELLLEIGSPDRWKVVLIVSERRIDAVRVGDSVRVWIPAIADLGDWIGRGFEGEVRFVGAAPVEGSGGYRVEAVLRGAPGEGVGKGVAWEGLRRGMSVDARIVTRSGRAMDLLLRKVLRGRDEG